jgi:hypothetical protein
MVTSPPAHFERNDVTIETVKLGHGQMVGQWARVPGYALFD